MTTDVSIEAATDAGSLEKLNELIRLRQQFLKGETTEMAVTATAINILSGVRARTKLADPDKASDFGYRVRMSTDVVAGFKKNKGGNPRRVVRVPGGHEITSAKVINQMGKYTHGEIANVYTVLIKNQKIMDKVKGRNYDRFYVIAHSEAEAGKWARKLVRKYIMQYRGMAKWAIGQAQSQVSQIGYSGDMPTYEGARKTALQNILVQTTGSGFSSGQYSVFISDRLGYAMLALEGGRAAFVTAIQKAANRTAGIINKLGAHSLEEKIPTPFPEVKGK